MKSLFYSLNAAIWVHALPESRLVRELTERGHETVYVSCGKVFRHHCTSMSAYGLVPESTRAQKDDVCRQCAVHAGILTGANGARHLRLADHLTDDDRAKAAAMAADVRPDNYLQFRVMDVPVGRVAAYELFLKYKKMSEQLGPDEWAYYLIYLENTLLSLLGFARIFDRERPENVFFYSPQYGVNGACADYAATRGARTYFVEGSSSNGERYSALRIWDWQSYGLVNPALAHWKDVAACVAAEDVGRLRSHFRELLHAKSFAVYSAPIEGKISVRARFNVPSGAKLLLATLSSYDEAYAAKIIGRFPDRKVDSPVFKDQFEWIKALVAHVATRPDLFLIVRVHPRDFSNKREEQRSEQSFKWFGMFETLPPNVVVNWPQDRISLYDFFREVDLVTTGWSATGVEAMAFGIPVVTYDDALPSYPPDIHFTGESVATYFDNLERGLASGRKTQHATGALRWLAANFSVGTVRIAAPIVIEKWLRVLIVRRLRNYARDMLDGIVKSFDARRRFGSTVDAVRFVELVERYESSLFDAEPRRKKVADAAANVDNVLSKMHRSLTRAIGIRDELS